MYVNPASNNSHLLIWVSGEAMVLGYMLGIYTFKAVLDSGAYSLVLKSIDDQYFQSSTNQDNVETSFKLVEGYLLRECGKRFKVSYRNRVLAEASIEELLKILLYCCLHSKTKQQYVERIFALDENIQSTLMSAIQEINSNLLNVVNYQ
jgi:predicted GNAT family acetyltransferase